MSDCPFTPKQIETLKKIANANEDNPVFYEPDKAFIKKYSLEEPITTLEEIINKVCTYHKIDKHDFKSRRRENDLVEARTDYAHLAKMKTNHSSAVIGRAINRDHATIIYYYGRKPSNIDGINGVSKKT